MTRVFSRRRVAGLLSVVFVAAAPAGAAVLHVRIEAAGGFVLPKRAGIMVHRVSGGQGANPMRVSARVAEMFQQNDVEVEAGVWRVNVVGTDGWPEEPVVAVSATEKKSVLVRIWPAGRLAGRVDTGGVDRGAFLDLTIESPPERRMRGVPRTSVRCPIQDGAWSCQVPAIELDVELRLKGFISHHRWGIRVPAGKTLDVGTLSFRQGAAIEGIVKLASGARADAACQVRLKTGFGAPVPSRVSGAPIAATLNARGFYQLVGMSPGRYVLEAVRPGWATTAIPAVVEGERTTRLPPLVMERPTTLELALNPAEDPSGQPWVVQLIDPNAGVSIGHARPATNSGSWRETGLGRGTYLVIVAASSGDRWLEREVEATSNGPIPIDLDVRALVGTVRLGKRPLPSAQVYFGGEHGAVRLVFTTDDDGRFRGVVPDPTVGVDWEVHVTAEDPPVRRTFRHVTPQPDPGSGEQTVDLVIPDVRLKGRVVDERGDPQDGIVNAQSMDQLERIVQVPTDQEGAFEIVGLPPGRAALLFEGKEASSGVVDVQLKEEAPTEATVVASRFRVLSGRVVSVDGEGIVGARIHSSPQHLPKLWLPPPVAQSESDGAFDVRLPHDTREVTLTVAAPGFALTSVQVSVAAGKELTVVVDRYGGTLVLEYPRIRAMDFYTAPAAYLVTETTYELLQNPLLNRWAAAHLALGEDPGGDRASREESGSSTLVLPQMSPGKYSLCLLTVRETLDVAGGRMPQDACMTGTLDAGGELLLRAGVKGSS